MEDMINQREDKGVWKGKVYSMVPYTMYQFDFRVNVPDFLLQVLHEDLAAANGPDSPFACMVSVKDMVSIALYVTAETKIYEPSEIHLLFGRLLKELAAKIGFSKLIKKNFKTKDKSVRFRKDHENLLQMVY